MPKKTQTEIELKLDEARTKLETKKQEFDDDRAKLKTQFEEKESEVKSHVEEGKTTHKVKKLEHRADKAEDYATRAIFLAMTMMEEAEEATLSAICSRLNAEAAATPAKK